MARQFWLLKKKKRIVRPRSVIQVFLNIFILQAQSQLILLLLLLLIAPHFLERSVEEILFSYRAITCFFGKELRRHFNFSFSSGSFACRDFRMKWVPSWAHRRHTITRSVCCITAREWIQRCFRKERGFSSLWVGRLRLSRRRRSHHLFSFALYFKVKAHFNYSWFWIIFQSLKKLKILM